MADRTQSARAVWFEGPRHAVLRSEEVPDPAPHEIQVKGLHSLVSAGSELNHYRGESNLPDGLLPTARGQLPFPIKFAYGMIGRVVAAGKESGYKVGDLVSAPHPHQELFNIPGMMTRPIGAHEDPMRVQLEGMFDVAVQSHLTRAVKVGEVVAVTGLGLIGMFSAYLARLQASKLILIEPNAMRREKAAWIGADAVVAPEQAAETIAALSDGRGADCFIETSGAPAALQTAISNTATLGAVLVAAWYGTRPVNLSLSPEFHLRALKIYSVHVSSLDEGERWSRPRKSQVAAHFMKNIDVNTLITHRFPFDNAPAAFQQLDQHPEETLGVIIEYPQ